AWPRSRRRPRTEAGAHRSSEARPTARIVHETQSRATSDPSWSSEAPTRAELGLKVPREPRQPERDKWPARFQRVAWRRCTTARTTGPSLVMPRAASSMCARFVMRAGTRSSPRTSRLPRQPRRPRSPPRRRRPPLRDHVPAVLVRAVASGGRSPRDPRGSPPGDLLSRLPGGHQALPARNLSVPRPGAVLVRRTPGLADDESLRRLASERLRRIVGISEGPGRPAGASGPRRGHLDPGRLRVLAGLRSRGDPAVPPLPRTREGPAAGRGGPRPRFD